MIHPGTARRDISDEELLGPAACRVADELAAAAPPLSPQQRDDLAVLLRRAHRRSNVKPTADAA